MNNKNILILFLGLMSILIGLCYYFFIMERGESAVDYDNLYFNNTFDETFVFPSQADE